MFGWKKAENKSREVCWAWWELQIECQEYDRLILLRDYRQTNDKVGIDHHHSEVPSDIPLMQILPGAVSMKGSKGSLLFAVGDKAYALEGPSMLSVSTLGS